MWEGTLGVVGKRGTDRERERKKKRKDRARLKERGNARRDLWIRRPYTLVLVLFPSLVDPQLRQIGPVIEN